MKRYVAGLVAALTLVGASCAAAATCPKVDTFKQNAGNYGGFEYTATTADGQKWTGEDPHAAESDLKTLVFKRVTLLAKDPYVACEYEGGDKAGVRMTPDPAKAVSATGDA